MNNGQLAIGNDMKTVSEKMKTAVRNQRSRRNLRTTKLFTAHCSLLIILFIAHFSLLIISCDNPLMKPLLEPFNKELAEVEETVEEPVVTPTPTPMPVLPPPVKVITHITAGFTPLNTIYEATPLNYLKNYLIVMVYYNDNTNAKLNNDDYSLSGTLIEGTTSEITVSYLGHAAVFNVDVAVTPSFGIVLSEIGTHTFASAVVGYSAQTALTVTVTNVGTEATGLLTVDLSGANVGSFELSATSIASIAANGDSTFTIAPNTGLAIGTYTATVTVSNVDVGSESFVVSFEVTAVPTYTITVNPNNTGFGTATANHTSAAQGESIIITATPASGYKFTGWTVVSVGVTIAPNTTTSPATFTMPGTAVEITANFAEVVPQTITASTYNSSPTFFLVNNSITASLGTYTANDGGAAGTHTFQWYRANDALGTSGKEAISGAVLITYTPVGADFGKYVWLETTPVGDGSLTGAAVPSSALQVGVQLSVEKSGGDTYDYVFIGTGDGKAMTVYNNTAINIRVMTNNVPYTGNVKWTASPAIGTFADDEAATTTYTLPAAPTAGTITLTATLTAATPIYSVGDPGPGGGTIFYVHPDPAGFLVEGTTGEIGTAWPDSYYARYLEVAPENASSSIIRWCNCNQSGCYSSGVTDLGIINGNIGIEMPNQYILNTIGQGRKHTVLIINYHTSDTNTNNAAIACKTYTNTSGKTDWFLPSIGELYLLFESNVSEKPTTGNFWSSSPSGNDPSWATSFFIEFSNGQRYNGLRHASTVDARAIRAF